MSPYLLFCSVSFFSCDSWGGLVGVVALCDDVGLVGGGS